MRDQKPNQPFLLQLPPHSIALMFTTSYVRKKSFSFDSFLIFNKMEFFDSIDDSSEPGILLFEPALQHRVGTDYTGELFFSGRFAGIMLRKQGVGALHL